MQHYEGPTPKRHYAYSNSPEVMRLDQGKLKRKTSSVKTAVTYVDKEGKQRYKGTPALRKSELLGDNYGLFFYCMI